MVETDMKVTLTESEVRQALTEAETLVEQALSRGAKVVNYRPHITPIQLQAVDVASKMAVCKAIGWVYEFQPWKTWNDPDLVIEGLTFDVKSSVYGNYLNVPMNQEIGKFFGYFYCHQLSKEPDISRWDVVGYCTSQTVKEKGRPTSFKPGMQPVWSVPVSELRKV